MCARMKHVSAVAVVIIATLGSVGSARAAEQNCADANARVRELEEKVRVLEARLKALDPVDRSQEKPGDIPAGDSVFLGNKDAKIVVTTFVDFQDPFGARVWPVMQEILDDPQLKGRVKIVVKQFPLSFHQNARPAAKAALAAAEQGKFAEMAQALYEHQKELDPESMLPWAKRAGLNVPKLQGNLVEFDEKYEAV